LPWESVRVNEEPDVIPGRLTVPEYEPDVVLIELLLNDNGEVTSVYPVIAFSEVIVIVTVTVIALEVPTALDGPLDGTVPENEPLTVDVAKGAAIVGVNVPLNEPPVAQVPPVGVMVAVPVMTNVFEVIVVDESAKFIVPALTVAAPLLGTDAEEKDAEGVLPFSGMIVPAKVASVNAFVKPLVPSTVVLAVGKPDAEMETDVPAGPDEGVTVTVGGTIVKLTAGGTPTES